MTDAIILWLIFFAAGFGLGSIGTVLCMDIHADDKEDRHDEEPHEQHANH